MSKWFNLVSNFQDVSPGQIKIRKESSTKAINQLDIDDNRRKISNTNSAINSNLNFNDIKKNNYLNDIKDVNSIQSKMSKNSILKVISYLSLNDNKSMGKIHNSDIKKSYWKRLREKEFNFYIAYACEDLTKRNVYDYSIKIYNIDEDTIVTKFRGHNSWVQCILYLNAIDNAYFASGSDDATIMIWSLNSPNSIRTLRGHTSFVLSLMHLNSMSNNTIISGSADKTIKAWNVINGTCIMTLKGHEEAVISLIQLPGLEVEVMRLKLKQDKNINLMPGNNKLKTTQNNQRNSIEEDSKDAFKKKSSKSIIINMPDENNKISVSMDNSNKVLFASSSFDKNIRIWDFSTSSCERILDGHKDSVSSVIRVFYEKDERLLSGSKDGKIKMWNHHKGICCLTLKGHNSPINSLSLIKRNKIDGDIVASSDEETVRVWKIETKSCINVIMTKFKITKFISLGLVVENLFVFSSEFGIYFENIKIYNNSISNNTFNMTNTTPQNKDFTVGIKKLDLQNITINFNDYLNLKKGTPAFQKDKLNLPKTSARNLIKEQSNDSLEFVSKASAVSERNKRNFYSSTIFK